MKIFSNRLLQPLHLRFLQTKALEDIVVESSQVQTESDASVAGPSSSIIQAQEVHPEPLSIVLSPSTDTPYAPFMEEPAVRWSVPEVEKMETN